MPIQAAVPLPLPELRVQVEGKDSGVTNSHSSAMKHFLYWLFGYRRVSLDGTVSYTWGRRVYVVPKNGAADGSAKETK